MRRRGLGIAAALLAVTVLVFMWWTSDSASYRFRMTVEVEMPRGVKIGSSVMEVSAERQWQITAEARPLLVGLRGEAVAVDLPDGPVFILLKMADTKRFNTMGEAVTYSLVPDIRPGGWEPFWKAINRLGGWFGGAEAELPREDWPLMMRFRDIDDPKSVERVDPDVIGVKRIVLETTSDDVTTGIRNRLRWMGDYPESRLDRDYRGSTNPNLAQKLSNGDFRQGTN